MKRIFFKLNVSEIFKFSWIAFSVLTVAVFAFIAEWIQREEIMIVPLGFKHISILTLFLLNWIIFGRPLRLNQYYTLSIILVLTYIIVAYFFVPVVPLNYVLGIVFTFLFVLLFILGTNTVTNKKAITNMLKGVLAFFFLMSIFPILNALIVGTTLRHVNPGLFRELGAFGSSMNVGVIICLALYIITKEKKYLYLSVFLSFGVFFTILKKSIFSNIIVWIGFGLFHISARFRLKHLLLGLLLILFSISIVGDDIVGDIETNIKYYKSTDPSEHVRLGMYMASYNIAKDYFPFGSGMGTFASLASITNGYSRIHHDYGVSKIGMNSPEAVAIGNYTLLDTYWPHIMAELGFIGFAVFLSIWLFPLISSFILVRFSDDSFIRGIGFYVIIIVLTMTNEGFTLYTPEIPSFILLHSGIAGLCYYHISNHRNI